MHRDVVGGSFSDYLQYQELFKVPHRHSFYHIVLFTHGTGTQIIDFEEYDFRPAIIYFMIPGQAHSWNHGNELDGLVVNFNEDLFSSFTTNPMYLEQFWFLRGIPKNSVIELKGAAFDEAMHFFRRAITEINRKDAFSLEMVCFSLMSLFISISRQNPIQKAINNSEQKNLVLFNFRKLIDQFYCEKKMPRDYAPLLFVTPNHLNALCNELLGISAGQLIRERILLEAKKMLYNTSNSISEIAYYLNFTDNSYFTKFFKKYVGISPEAFRRKNADSV